MSSFQLDQCSNHAAFADRCNQTSGAGTVLRLPKRLMDQDDNVVLSDLLPRLVPVLTMDFAIVEDNPKEIEAAQESNGGIIVVRAVPNKARLMEQLVAKFKTNFPNWNRINWSKIYMEIEDSGIYIKRLESNTDGGVTILYSEPKFEACVSEEIGRIQES